MPEQSLIDYFFPYQKRYLLDKSKVKILEKSRRIGGTYVQSFEDVQDCIEQPGLKIFFSSADMTAAAEYMDYISGWVAKLNTIAKALAEINCEDISECEFADEDKGVKSKVIEFNNGSKIYALSSNPKAFRSKGGKIVWDEAAHHKDDRKMWAAAKPAAMWGFSIRILSTHNGVNSLFYILIDKCRKGELDYSVHTVPIQLAVEEGVADRICGRKLTKKEREEWLEQEHKGCLTEAIWQEEYCCNPQDESKAMIGYDLIHSCERQGVLGMEKAKGKRPSLPRLRRGTPPPPLRHLRIRRCRRHACLPRRRGLPEQKMELPGKETLQIPDAPEPHPRLHRPHRMRRPVHRTRTGKVRFRQGRRSSLHEHRKGRPCHQLAPGIRRPETHHRKMPQVPRSRRTHRRRTGRKHPRCA